MPGTRVHPILSAFCWAFAACLISMGTALLPWYTLSSRVTTSEISLRKECLFSGENWDCQQPHMRTPAEDTGAISWQEIPAGAFFHNSAITDSSKYPKWNPYIGSGYPIFLDGISRTSTPSRILLSLFPTDGTRDFIIFFRFVTGQPASSLFHEFRRFAFKEKAQRLNWMDALLSAGRQIASDQAEISRTSFAPEAA